MVSIINSSKKAWNFVISISLNLPVCEMREIIIVLATLRYLIRKVLNQATKIGSSL